MVYFRIEIPVYYFRKWSSFEEFDLLLSKLRENLCSKRGQDREASVGAIDSQSVKWGNNKVPNDIDGNKKVKGIKRHVVVDKMDF